MWCIVQTSASVSTISELIMYVKVIQCSREFACFNVWEHSTFSHSKCFSFIISSFLLVFPLWRLFNNLWSCTVMYYCLLYNKWIYLLIGVQWGCVTYRLNDLSSLLPPHIFVLVISMTETFFMELSLQTKAEEFLLDVLGLI